MKMMGGNEIYHECFRILQESFAMVTLYYKHPTTKVAIVAHGQNAISYANSQRDSFVHLVNELPDTTATNDDTVALSRIVDKLTRVQQCLRDPAAVTTNIDSCHQVFRDLVEMNGRWDSADCGMALELVKSSFDRSPKDAASPMSKQLELCGIPGRLLQAQWALGIYIEQTSRSAFSNYEMIAIQEMHPQNYLEPFFKLWGLQVCWKTNGMRCAGESRRSSKHYGRRPDCNQMIQCLYQKPAPMVRKELTLGYGQAISAIGKQQGNYLQSGLQSSMPLALDGTICWIINGMRCARVEPVLKALRQEARLQPNDPVFVSETCTDGEEGTHLGRWARDQRYLKAAGKLSPERIAKPSCLLGGAMPLALD
ncbi:hypothetical protein SEMRO_3496_G348630.1 [Seminavis robusta]|uniref:Uncharacterized protein n=1 Tax=Seminavis robusta TaxID=568900 RepID=A0A9N8HY01_9STRA|nr:hypothetical protein SEMRO_3496_G348630.1 [Seminavis robusta]|eukprot:Sro3496_g348630.1 n/a (367) ;mRNA; r:2092-3192